MESWETQSEHHAGSPHGREFGLLLNGDGEAAGKQTSAQVLTCPVKVTEGRGCGLRPRLGEWRAHRNPCRRRPGVPLFGLWTGAGEAPGCCLPYKAWLLELRVYPGSEILFPDAPHASPES